ncbi:hypothetical protein K438DRAFT_1757306 [Mycena galopus ATCC 62051]|nr:hypothetical protein K438DRAFT_1757306 [Mycena galopus ATCC 62051]
MTRIRALFLSLMLSLLFHDYTVESEIPFTIYPQFRAEPFETAQGRNLIWVLFTVRARETFYPPLTKSSYGHDCPFASRIILELAVAITATAFHIGHGESGIPRHCIVSVRRPTEDLLGAFVEMLSQFRVSEIFTSPTSQ